MDNTIAIKERPIIFSGGMVRAVLDGRKTRTRRVVQPQPVDIDEVGPYLQRMIYRGEIGFADRDYILCRYGEPGDQLWVRETWAPANEGGAVWFRAGVPVYRAGRRRTGEWSPYDKIYGLEIPEGIKWRSPRFMPRWTSRINLEITGVKAERLQDITDGDALAEGIERFDYGPDSYNPSVRQYAYGLEKLALGVMDFTAKSAYRKLWDNLNAKRGYPWDANPWVWVIDFALISE